MRRRKAVRGDMDVVEIDHTLRGDTPSSSGLRVLIRVLAEYASRRHCQANSTCNRITRQHQHGADHRPVSWRTRLHLVASHQSDQSSAGPRSEMPARLDSSGDNGFLIQDSISESARSRLLSVITRNCPPGRRCSRRSGADQDIRFLHPRSNETSAQAGGASPPVWR